MKIHIKRAWLSSQLLPKGHQSTSLALPPAVLFKHIEKARGENRNETGKMLQMAKANQLIVQVVIPRFFTLAYLTGMAGPSAVDF